MIRPRATSSSASPKPAVDCILDSGAFSAWRLGKPINIDEYCDFLLTNASWVGHYVNLDVINPQDPEQAAADSFANLLHMRKRGLRPVPVYHAGEDISWLYRMLDLGCDYIGISASSIVSRNQVNDWYAMAWEHLVTPQGKPTVKAHAFGEGRIESMLAFPWKSADSTSWIYDAQRNGAMTMPGGAKVVHRNDGLHAKAAQDIDGMQEHDKTAFEAMLAELGVDPAGFAERGSKTSVILRTYISLMDCLFKQRKVRAACPIAFRGNSFFPKQTGRTWVEDHAANVDPFNFHLVIGGNAVAASVLAFAGYDNALASYFYIKSMSFYSSLRDFTLAPRQTCSTGASFKESYAILERYVKLPAWAESRAAA